MPESTLNQVPESDVGKEVQKFIDFDGKTKITCTKNADDTWTIVATN